MKKSLNVLIALVLVLGFSSCVKETVEHTYTYKLYRPVYSTKEVVRASIGNTAVKPVKKPGKLYLLNNYIFLVETGEGIHIINNANPANPVNEAFIKIPGCEDIAANGTTLYADCYTDLFVINIANPHDVKLTTYVKNIFPNRQFVNGFYFDTSSVAVEWIEKDTTVTDIHTNNGFFVKKDFGIFMDTRGTYSYSYYKNKQRPGR
jgi:hypothetical protein